MVSVQPFVVVGWMHGHQWSVDSIIANYINYAKLCTVMHPGSRLITGCSLLSTLDRGPAEAEGCKMQQGMHAAIRLTGNPVIDFPENVLHKTAVHAQH
jgi:hypothetical protein